MFKSFKNKFILLLQFSTWIFSLVSPFILPPPEIDTSQDANFWIKFSQIILALFIGLLFVPISLYSKRKYIWRWWSLALSTVVLGVSLIFFYKNLRDENTVTVEYKGQNVKAIIGNVLTEDATKYNKQEKLKSGHDLPPDSLILAYAVGPSKFNVIWTPESIKKSQMQIFLTYTCTLIIFSISIIAVIEALKILSND